MKEIDDEFTYSISQTTDGNVIEFNFHGSVSRDGDDAVYFFNKFKEKLKGTIIHYDLTLTARFIQ